MNPVMLPEGNTAYTYEDLLSWGEEERYELVDGVPCMLASPRPEHQEAVRELSRQISTYLLGKKCRLFTAPFDVRLFEEDGDAPADVTTVVQPDLLAVCDLKKLDRHGLRGAPDLVIEVLSDSTAFMDEHVKFELYSEAGVREYWIVDPLRKTVKVFLMENARGEYRRYGAEDAVRVHVLEDCTVDLKTVFDYEVLE